MTCAKHLHLTPRSQIHAGTRTLDNRNDCAEEYQKPLRAHLSIVRRLPEHLSERLVPPSPSAPHTKACKLRLVHGLHMRLAHISSTLEAPMVHSIAHHFNLLEYVHMLLLNFQTWDMWANKWEPRTLRRNPCSKRFGWFLLGFSRKMFSQVC